MAIDEDRCLALEALQREFTSGTTSVMAADNAGWVVSVTPSGGWVPAVIAGGVGAIAIAGLWAALFPSLRRLERAEK